MSLAVVVVGRVGQFSSNTTNTLLENLMSCLMKNVKHDLPTTPFYYAHPQRKYPSSVNDAERKHFPS